MIGLGLIDEPIQILYTETAIMLGMLYVYLPLMVLPLYAAWKSSTSGWLRRLRSLCHTLQGPVASDHPVVEARHHRGSILVFIPSLGAYVTPRVLGGGKNMMLGNLIELQFGQGRNWPLGAALSITLMAS